MQTFIILMNLTERGVRGIKKAPEVISSNIKALEAAGGKMIGLYAILGDYDYVAIIEAPDDRVIVKHLLEISAGSAVVTKTLKAFPHEEFIKLIGELS